MTAQERARPPGPSAPAGPGLRLRTYRRRRGATALPVEISGVLDDIADLRLHLAADLSLVAGAAEADVPAVGADILGADTDDIRAARARMVATLDDAAARPAGRSRHLRPALAAAGTAVLGMAAALALMFGVPSPGVPVQSAPAAESGISAAQNSYAALLQAVQDSDETGGAAAVAGAGLDGPVASQVLPAANRLHRALEQLIATASTNPNDAAVAARLLTLERELLTAAQPPDASAILAEAQQLSQRLQVVAPQTGLVPMLVPTPAPSTAPTAPSAATPSTRPSGTQPAAPAPSSGTAGSGSSGTSPRISVPSDSR